MSLPRGYLNTAVGWACIGIGLATWKAGDADWVALVIGFFNVLCSFWSEPADAQRGAA